MEIRSFTTDIFNLFDRHWALLTAGTIDHYNAMTISWGSMGTIWGPPSSGRPIITVYVNPLRYTYGVLNETDRFTVSFFPAERKQDLLLMGSRSGRDGDPLKGTSLTPADDLGYVTWNEASLTFACRKLYQETMKKENIPAGIANAFYGPDEQAHRMYIGEVVRIIEGKNR
jgi:flavin reductase (DIM6/NTAB) family NADH-FMN oxidoreductase RutF